MAGSPNFARIDAQVRDILERVPPGRVTTYAAVGEELDVPARHVAHLLMHADDVPWHRAVAVDGALTRGRRRREHERRLTAEGVPVLAVEPPEP